jgi:hypothetical protein
MIFTSRRRSVFEIEISLARDNVFPLLDLRSCDWPNYLKSHKIFSPYQFSIHQNQFSYPEVGGSTLIRNAGTFNHRMTQKPQRRPSSALIYRLCSRPVFFNLTRLRAGRLKNWGPFSGRCVGVFPSSERPFSGSHLAYYPMSTGHKAVVAWCWPLDCT